MEDEVNENNVYVRHVECTWVAHSMPGYFGLGEFSGRTTIAFRLNWNKKHFACYWLIAALVDEYGGSPIKFKDVMLEQGGPTILNFR